MSEMLALYKKYSIGLLAATLVSGIVLGYALLGPLVTSGALEWFQNLPEIAKELLNVESMIIDSLVSACVPMFLLWSVAFYSYEKAKENVDGMNSIFPLVWLFAKSPATLVLFLSSSLVGLCIYGWRSYLYSPALSVLTILAVFLIVIGFVLRAYCTPKLENNKFLNNYSQAAGHACALLTIIAYLWGIFSEPVSFYLIINAAMKNG